MSSRQRTGRRAITGPQSALTDFLATHNISAAQIRNDYAARVAAAEQDEAGPSNTGNQENDENEDGDMDIDEEEQEETTQKSKKRKRETQKAIEKIKKSKAFAKKKAQLDGEPGGDDDDGLAFDMYAKARVVPGQMENCEECEKRFTVTPYTKEGPDGGLLCTKCGKAQDDAKKKDVKAKKAPVVRGKRNKAQSNLMEGHGPQGSKSLLETCVERVAKSIEDIDDFGELPPLLYDRLSMILSKHRVLDSRTLDLFLSPDNQKIGVYDCGKLQTDDFVRIFQICPKLQRVDLRHAGQFKDRVLDYILERKIPLRHLRLNAANLITDAKWQEYFKEAGPELLSLQLSWLDFAMTNPSIEALVTHCQNLQQLKLKQLFHADDETLRLLSQLKNLEHLSLSFPNPTDPAALTALVYNVGSKLQSLCLRDFADANDTLIDVIATTCKYIKKLVISNNDRITDDAFTALFTNWSNPPLEKAIFTSSREVDADPADENKPEEEQDAGTVAPGTRPQQPQEQPKIGLSSNGFTALMQHSGVALQKVSIASCRSISHSALLDVFNGVKQYPCLAEIDISFVSGVDTTIIAGIFKSCPKLAKLVAFGCFDIKGVHIPRGVALIGVPAAQEGIIQEGIEDLDL